MQYITVIYGDDADPDGLEPATVERVAGPFAQRTWATTYGRETGREWDVFPLDSPAILSRDGAALIPARGESNLARIPDADVARYRCARFGCDRRATVVYSARVGIYGACDEHTPTELLQEA